MKWLEANWTYLLLFEAWHFRKSSFYSITLLCAMYCLCLKHCTISSATSWHHILLVICKLFPKMNNVWLLCRCKALSVWSGIWINFSTTISLNAWTTDCCVTCLFCLKVNTALKKAMHQFVPDKLCSCICSPPGCHFTFFKEQLSQSVTLGFVFLTLN